MSGWRRQKEGPPAYGSGPWLATNLALALAYGAFGLLIELIGRGVGQAVPLWPSAGLALALVLQCGPGLLPGVALGALACHAPWWQLPSTAVDAGAVVGAVVGAIAAAWLGALLVRRWLGSRPALVRPGEIVAFLLLTGPTACGAGVALQALVPLGMGLGLPGEALRELLVRWGAQSIGVVVFAPLVLMLLPAQADLWVGRRWMVALPSLLVTLLAMSLFLAQVHDGQRQLALALEEQAFRAQSALQLNLVRHEGALQAVRSLFATSLDVDREDFRQFTLAHFQDLHGLHALSWNPLLSPGDRPGFEAWLRQQHGDDTLALWERSGGRLQTEGWRSRYVPVALIEPLPSNRQALGYDIHSDPVRAEAIRRALATGRAQASAPVQLVQDAGQQPGMLLLLPVPQRGPIRPQEPPLGFAVGVYRLGDLLADSFVDPTWRSLQFRLLDVTPGAPAQELAALPAVPAPASPLLSSQTFPHAGRLWQLQVRPTAAFLASYGAPISSSLLLAALAVSVLLEAFLLLMSGQERQSRLQLEERLQTSLMTAAMAHEIKQPLTTLLMRSSLLDRVLANPLPLPRRQELEEVAHGIRVDVKRLSTTINQVRELMQKGEVQRRPLDLRNPVHGALMLVQAEAERCQVSVLTRGLEQPAACIGDRDQLQLMVLNLLRNSIEAVPSGGQVELRLEQRASGLRLEVADDGPGFPASTLAAAGLPIASSKQRGFGLGLYLVRRAVANHDGQLLLGRSDLGGASAQVLLPVAGLAGPSLRRSAPPRPEP